MYAATGICFELATRSLQHTSSHSLPTRTIATSTALENLLPFFLLKRVYRGVYHSLKLPHAGMYTALEKFYSNL